MSVYKGKNIEIEIFGCSHDPFIGGTVKGLSKYSVNIEELNGFLKRRKPNYGFSTSRKESDYINFDGLNGNILTDKVSFKIANNNIKKEDYSDLLGKPRPSHADYTWYVKDNNLDFSGGGRFSGRLTLPFCVIGGICKQILLQKGIDVCAYISKIKDVSSISYKESIIKKDFYYNNISGFPSLNNKQKYIDYLNEIKNSGDSVGGIIECIIYNFPSGIGDNLFDGLEGKISNLIFSIPAVKGVEFGLGFDFSDSNGSKVNDTLKYIDNKVCFNSNYCGGIYGGISAGNDITLSVAFKPTPSISKEQETVDLINKQNTKISIKGRHDSCIVPRAVPVVESAVSIAILDELL